MDCDIEVRQMSIATFVKKNIVGFKIPVNYPVFVEKCKSRCDLGYIKSNRFLWERTQSIKVKSKITSKHKVQNKEAILIILESITQIDNKWVINLLQESSLLDYVGYSFHFNTLGFIDVLESIELASLFVLDYTNLAKSTLSNTTV